MRIDGDGETDQDGRHKDQPPAPPGELENDNGVVLFAWNHSGALTLESLIIGAQNVNPPVTMLRANIGNSGSWVEFWGT
jgi:hypothetical protein